MVSGYTNTSFSKGLSLFIGINSIVAGPLFPISLHNTNTIDFLLVIAVFWIDLVYSSSVELFLGSLVLYHCRVLERHWGSRRFASVFVLATLISTLINVGLLSLFKISRMSPGINGFLYTLVLMYLKDIPTSYQVKIMGITFSDHFFLVALSIQLMLINSIVSASSGLIAGLLIVLLPPLQKWRIPKLISRFCTFYLLPLLQSNVPTTRSEATTMRDLNRPESALPTPSEEDIVMLESMGFPRARVIEALQFARNDVQGAIAFLLNNQ